MRDKITEDDKNLVIESANQTEQWLRSNPNATLEELESQKKLLEDKFNPIMAKLYG